MSTNSAGNGRGPLWQWGILPWVFVGLFVGIGSTSFGQLWFGSFLHKPIVITNIDVQPLSDGGYKLVVHLITPKTPECLRLSEHIISPDPGAPHGEYVPLASALAGGDFSNGGPILVDLKVHPGMVQPGSTWYYTYLVAYECTRFPGFLRVSGLQSNPIRIVF